VSTHLQVTDKTPPIFIFQTDDDTVVPAENAVNFYLACRKHHVPAEMHIYKPGPHGVGLMQGDPVLGTWPQHLAAWLRNQGFFSTAKRAAVVITVHYRASEALVMCIPEFCSAHPKPA
jgi:acetyl esterase/lipase